MIAASEEEPITGRTGEQGRVEAWRLNCLIDAGLPVPAAELIAAGGADLHTVVRAVERGCSPELAALVFA